ncbi:PDDEXK nuclease domain-containing protein [Methylovulum miyakonense]|uniref:PDDEXK nuclease domain-containing protein n=1 Tax=Methylovulum miyakonense TaxID=645578 RepID=UPI0003620E32|nr:PDDEXK nuclease domain-containing protein [Methylovulum miyakonense]
MSSEDNALGLPKDYADWLAQLKSKIAQARQRAAFAVNAELINLYRQIGGEIVSRQAEQGWGSKVIERLAHDLKDAFPDMRGWSSSNLKYMRFFAQHCPDGLIGQQPADQLPWFHIVTLLTKLADTEEREWYALQAVQQGWSRTSLEVHIKNRLRQRQGAAVSNFAARLPLPHANLAQEALKDPYLFDFLGLGDDAQEREIENALIRHIIRFLLELGAGFAFVGRQFRLDVDGDEFFIDLLFYHTRLKCYVVVELKATAFKPEHIGQLNFYLAVVDAQIKAADDQPTIGLLLCKKQNRLVAQYALSGIDKPIGVAEYQLLRDLPETLASNLPSIAEIEAEMAMDMGVIDDE